MGLLWHLNCVLKLDWIARNRIDVTLNCLKWNCFSPLTKILEIERFWYLNCVLILNSIVWCRTVFGIEIILTVNILDMILNHFSPVGWGCRIHWPHHCRGVRLPHNECRRYAIKQSDGEVPVILGLWGMRRSQGHFDPEWLHLIGPYLWVT